MHLLVVWSSFLISLEEDLSLVSFFFLSDDNSDVRLSKEIDDFWLLSSITVIFFNEYKSCDVLLL